MGNPLGKKVGVPQNYDPSVLYPINRSEQREGLESTYFTGYDAWNIHELLWLDESNCLNQDEICIKIDAQSKAIPESKSMKLYIGSLVYRRFACQKDVLAIIKQELDKLTESDVVLEDSIYPTLECATLPVIRSTTPLLESKETNELISDHLFTGFRSLCPVTDQPDIAKIYIKGSLSDIDKSNIQNYLGTYFDVNTFHEACIEQIFTNLINSDYGIESIAGHFERRGGISIIPVRFHSKFYQI